MEQKEINKEELYPSALFSKAVYKDDRLITLADKYHMSVKVFETDNHRAAIVQDALRAFVIFCGTDDIKDWLVNLKYSQVPIGLYGYVHQGFNDAYKALGKRMNDDLFRLSRNGKRVIVTGHSLGGALAIRHLVGLKMYDSHCYTFGAPRVGNEPLFNLINTGITRVVNDNDIVPHVPLEHGPISGTFYSHPPGATLLSISRGGIITVGERSLWAGVKARAMGKVDDFFDADIVPDEIEDHDIDCYCDTLREYCGDSL